MNTRPNVFDRMVYDGGNIPPIDTIYIGWRKPTLTEWHQMNYYVSAFAKYGTMKATVEATNTNYRFLKKWLELAKAAEIYEGVNVQ